MLNHTIVLNYYTQWRIHYIHNKLTHWGTNQSLDDLSVRNKLIQDFYNIVDCGSLTLQRKLNLC